MFHKIKIPQTIFYPVSYQADQIALTFHFIPMRLT